MSNTKKIKYQSTGQAIGAKMTAVTVLVHDKEGNEKPWNIRCWNDSLDAFIAAYKDAFKDCEIVEGEYGGNKTFTIQMPKAGGGRGGGGGNAATAEASKAKNEAIKVANKLNNDTIGHANRLNNATQVTRMAVDLVIAGVYHDTEAAVAEVQRMVLGTVTVLEGGK